ncbi:uncharacterized protein LOC143445763 [Clavelina lepadiformis]|uniref:uncharacterized protein LOC143445763 n=1 Tax=Clavelina lepadiformis TaxID=159417 RepID=UPI004041786A
MKVESAAILFCPILLLTLCEGGLYDRCKLKVSSGRGRVQMKDCQVNDDASGVTQRSVILTESMTKQRRNDITLDFKPDPAAKGNLKIFLRSEDLQPVTCGNLDVADIRHNGGEVRIQVECEEATERRRREVGRKRLVVDLPGCTLPEFQDSVLCKGEEQKRIRFQVRRIESRPAIRVILARDVYKSEDKKRGRARRYHVAIAEESPADVWLRHGRVLELHQLRWPKRNVRSRRLELKKTYVVVVWRSGSVKRYSRTITVC